jgi:hypothetical protein
MTKTPGIVQTVRTSNKFCRDDDYYIYTCPGYVHIVGNDSEEINYVAKLVGFNKNFWATSGLIIIFCARSYIFV